MQPLNGAEPPEIILDNLHLSRIPIPVGVVQLGGPIYLKGPGSANEMTIQSWALGRRYTSRNGKHNDTFGLVNPAPVKPSSLVDSNGRFFVRSRPTYANFAADDWTVATDHGVANDGTGDQTETINKLLSGGQHVYFPAGVYQVFGTVEVPLGSILTGSGWSQIRGTGPYFGDINNPKPVIRVGNPGDKGSVEISDMLFTVRGANPGAILMEWNVKESIQGSAAMWDSHFRIGGAAGTELTLEDCPIAGGLQPKCMAAAMLLHVTEQASGYFENVWVWTADQ